MFGRSPARELFYRLGIGLACGAFYVSLPTGTMPTSMPNIHRRCGRNTLQLPVSNVSLTIGFLWLF